MSGHKKCPICNKDASDPYKPFCSRRCADVDLARWFSGAYAIPLSQDEDKEGSSETE